MQTFTNGNVTTYYLSGVYAASTEVPDGYATGFLDYGYLVLDAAGNETVRWKGSVSLTLTSETASSVNGVDLGLLRQLNSMYGITESVEGVDEYNAAIDQINEFLETGDFDVTVARAQCEAWQAWLAEENPVYSPTSCDCIGANLTIDNSCQHLNATGLQTAFAAWSGYIMQLEQRDISTGALLNLDELEAHESSPFSPDANFGVMSMSCPVIYFPAGTSITSINATIEYLKEVAVTGDIEAVDLTSQPADAAEALDVMQTGARLLISFNMTDGNVEFALISGEDDAATAATEIPASGTRRRRTRARELSFVQEYPRTAGGYFVPWRSSSDLDSAEALTITYPSSTIFNWQDTAGKLAVVPNHVSGSGGGVAYTGLGHFAATDTALNQAILRVCIEVAGDLACNVVPMLLDPANNATVPQGGKRFQMQLGVAYSDLPIRSSPERVRLAADLQLELSALFGIQDYRIQIRDFVSVAEEAAVLGTRRARRELQTSAGSYATFDVLAATSEGDITPAAVGTAIDAMLQEPSSALLDGAPADSVFRTLDVIDDSELLELNSGVFIPRDQISPPDPPPPPPSVPPPSPYAPGAVPPSPSTPPTPSPPPSPVPSPPPSPDDEALALAIIVLIGCGGVVAVLIVCVIICCVCSGKKKSTKGPTTAQVAVTKSRQQQELASTSAVGAAVAPANNAAFTTRPGHSDSVTGAQPIAPLYTPASPPTYQAPASQFYAQPATTATVTHAYPQPLSPQSSGQPGDSPNPGGKRRRRSSQKGRSSQGALQTSAAGDLSAPPGYV